MNWLGVRRKISIYPFGLSGRNTHFQVGLDKKIEQITTGYYDYASLAPVNDNCLIAMRHSLSQPDEIYSIDPQSKEVKEISSRIKIFWIKSLWVKSKNAG